MARGEPISWRHYVYGLRYLGRAHMRTQLRDAQALRMGQTPDQEAYSTWQRDLQLMTTPPLPTPSGQPPRTANG